MGKPQAEAVSYRKLRLCAEAREGITAEAVSYRELRLCAEAREGITAEAASYRELRLCAEAREGITAEAVSYRGRGFCVSMGESEGVFALVLVADPVLAAAIAIPARIPKTADMA